MNFCHPAVRNIVVQQAKEAGATFDDPDGHNDVHHGLLRKRRNVGMVVYTYQHRNCKDLVKVQKDFVESVADR